MALLFALWAAAGSAQEITPRAYWPAPKGTKVAVIGYSYGEGEVLFDSSVPLYGVDSQLNAMVLAYTQTFSVFGRSANMVANLPYVWGTTSGSIAGNPAKRDFSGLSDIELTFAINLIGAPSMNAEQFQALRAKPHPILGFSLSVVAPTGRYDGNKIINVGSNRWSVKPEFGFMVPVMTV